MQICGSLAIKSNRVVMIERPIPRCMSATACWTCPGSAAADIHHLCSAITYMETSIGLMRCTQRNAAMHGTCFLLIIAGSCIARLCYYWHYCVPDAHEAQAPSISSVCTDFTLKVKSAAPSFEQHQETIELCYRRRINACTDCFFF